MGWHVKGHGSKVDLFVRVHTWHDKEEARSLSSTRPESTQAKDNCSLVLLDHLDSDAEREGQGDEHQHERDEREEHGTYAGPLRIGCKRWTTDSASYRKLIEAT